MAMDKYADAAVKQTSVGPEQWREVRKSSIVGQQEGFGKTASPEFKDYDPDKYLLTHCTIIASVDTDEADVKTGTLKEAGQEIYRPHNDFLITSETSQYVNQNGDAWERELLLATYDTFVGSESYVEHVQIPELSKGKVVDACARDLGDTIYVDILVATDKKHEDLIQKIATGEIDTLSMGCFMNDAPVLMADGTEQKIEDVRPGDEVYTHEGRVKSVTNIQRRQWDEEVVDIETIGTNDVLTATTNHPFLTIRPQEKCACGCGESLQSRSKDNVSRRLNKRFVRGHFQRILNTNGDYDEQEQSKRESVLDDIKSPNIEWVEAGNLKERDWLVFPESSVVEEPNDLDEQDARLMGYYLAEGNLLKNNEGEPFALEMSFSLEERDDLAQEAADILQNKGCDVSVYEREGKNISVVRGHSPEMAQWIQKTCGEYSDQKYVRRNVLVWPTEYKKQLLGAYFNGDGTEETSSGLSAVTVSYRLFSQIKSLLQSLGAFVTEWVRGDDELHSTGREPERNEDNKLPSYKIALNSTQREVIDDYTYYDSVDTKEQQGRNIDGYIIVPVTSVETRPYEGTVYNFEVEGDHSYIVNGYAVHNCTIAYSVCSRCGNVAHEETDLCEHALNQKGQTFVDSDGNERITAELCGHKSDPESVEFIEASWVGNPAFEGAVCQEVMNPDMEVDKSKSMPNNQSSLQDMIANDFVDSVAEQNIEVDGFFDSVAASVNSKPSPEKRRKVAQGFGDDDEEEDDGGDDASVFEELKEEVKEQLGEKVKEDIEEEFSENGDGQHPPDSNDEQEGDVDGPNESVIQSRAAKHIPQKFSETTRQRIWNEFGKLSGVRSGSPDYDEHTLFAYYLQDTEELGKKKADALHECITKVGSLDRFSSPESYLASCTFVLGRLPSEQEAQRIIRRARCID